MSLKLWKCIFSFCVKNPKDIWAAYTQFTVRSVHTEAAAAMLGQQAAEKKTFCEVVRECTRVRPRIEMFQLLEQ